jgi:nitroreductase
MLKEIKQRFSPLLFKKKAVPESALKRCLEAAQWAPSCNNKQPWKFYLVETPSLKDKFSTAFPLGNHWCLKAPIIGFIVSSAELDCVTEDNDNLAYFQYDCGMAMMSFILQAEAEGLKSHQMAGYSEKEVRKLLKIPANQRVIVAFAVGYEEKLEDYKGEALHPRLLERITTTKRVRKPLDEVYSLN